MSREDIDQDQVEMSSELGANLECSDTGTLESRGGRKPAQPSCPAANQKAFLPNLDQVVMRKISSANVWPRLSCGVADIPLMFDARPQ